MLLKNFLFLMIVLTGPFAAAADWRKEGSQEQQVKNLVKTVPGTAHWMLEIGERYRNLYWAARLGKWEFALYQVEEIEKTLKIAQVARPKRAKTAQKFLESAIPMIEKAVKSKSWFTFEKGFKKLNAACMRCHVQNQHGFIKLPLKPRTASSPVLNMR